MKTARNNKSNIYRLNFFRFGKQNFIVHLLRTRVSLKEIVVLLYIVGFRRSEDRRKDGNSTRKTCTEQYQSLLVAQMENLDGVF